MAGAGIGGLAAALALAQAGCRVTLRERSEALAEVGAGVQISPNACRVLDRLGALPALADEAVESTEVVIRRGRDGGVLARVPQGEAARRRYGQPSLLVLRAGLQRALLAAVRADPRIALVLGRGVAGFREDDEGIAVSGTAGDDRAERFEGLVAADGIRSALRPAIAGSDADALRTSGRTAWRSLVPAEAVEAAVRVPRSTLWLGPRAHLVHYPVDRGRRVNVVAILDRGPRPGGADPWSAPGDPNALETRFATWAPAARRLVAAAPAWHCWDLRDQPPLARWSRGRTTLVGDAAHPMLPFLAQGAAQALEDAAALGDAVAASPRDLAAAFLRYEAARRPRAARVQAESARQARIYHLVPPLSLARDLVLRSLPSERLLARYDWLYGATHDENSPSNFRTSGPEEQGRGRATPSGSDGDRSH